MSTLEWVRVADVQREVDDKILAVLEEFEPLGWRLRRQGHKFRFYCPCGPNGTMLRVDGTPRNPEQQAKRLRREIGHCPDRHALDK